jgi:hypothetical protein
MATKPPDTWPDLMRLHMELTEPVSVPEPIECPKCGDEMEPIWTHEKGELPPPIVCPTCLLLIEDKSI